MVFTWLRSATPLARPRSCGISFAGRLTAILQIDQGHDDACPDPFVVWLVLRLAHEGEQVFSQGNKLHLRQADRGPLERDLSSLPCFLGHTCRGNIGPCGLKHGTEKISELKRGSLVAGWLNVRWLVHPLDLAPRKAAVLRNLNQPGLFELGKVVVEPVRCHAGPLCQFFGLTQTRCDFPVMTAIFPFMKWGGWTRHGGRRCGGPSGP